MGNKNIDAIYTLSPQQQGMLFESLAAEGSGIHIEQEVFPWRGDLKIRAFEHAWQQVLDRHWALRTAFAWRDRVEPLQAVLQRSPIPLERHDLRALSVAAQQDFVAKYLETDRRRGFDMSRAPLMRFAVFQLADEAWQVAWTFHHILMDGWCLPIVQREFLAFYAAETSEQKPDLEPVRPYRDYITWLKRKDVGAAEAFWRGVLSGFAPPTPLGRLAEPAAHPPLDERYGTYEVRVSAAETTAMRSFARRHRLTMNTVIQGAWAALLSRYSGHDDVLFGTTVSGRPPELDGVDGIVGLFINTLPFRVRDFPDRPVHAWLQGLQAQHLELREYEYCSTGQIHQWGEVPGALPLYESVLVFENYPDDGAVRAERHQALSTGPEDDAERDGAGFFVGARTRFPLSLLVAVRQELLCRFVFDRRRLSDTSVACIAHHVLRLLKSITADPRQGVMALRESVLVEEIPPVAPAPDWTEKAPLGSFLAPRTPTEELLAYTWAAVLGLRQVSVDQNFFEMGGHSLLATQVASRVRSSFGIELPLRCLFESPTIAGLAERVDAARRSQRGVAAPSIGRAVREGNLPVSFSQERLWFLDQLLPDTSVYNIPEGWRFRGPLNGQALRQALNEIVRRHEALRTSFQTIDGQAFQLIAPSLELELPVVDLSELPSSDREREALRLASEEATRRFDLSTGPLIRASLLRLEHDEHVLLLTMHHIVSDGWSLGVFFRELSVLYEACCRGEASPLPELPIQYADFSIWQRQWLQGPVLDAQLEYWRERLREAPPQLGVPADRPRPRVQTFHGADELLPLPRTLSALLKELSKREEATLFMTLLAAFKVLLFRYSGQEDLMVGTPIAGRNRAEIEGLIGFFINTLVLRTDLSGSPSFRELLGRVREAALGAYVHQELPFERLLEELRPGRDLGRTPLFQVFFNLLNYTRGGSMSLSGLEVETFAPVPFGSRFDLTLYASERHDYIQLYLVYNPDLFDKARMKELLAQYEHLLWAIVTNPDEKIVRFSLVTEPAHSRLPDAAASLRASSDPPAHVLFTAQARRMPDRIAVVDATTTWTYGELDRISTDVAVALRTDGIEQGDVVAVYACRAATLVVALLGVMKAGAAFQILDQAHPAGRLVDYVRTAAARGLIQLEATGPLPAVLQSWVDGASLRSRITIGRDLITTPAGTSTVSATPFVDHDDLAYMAFTSGTTGAPKAVAGTHGPLSHFLEWHKREFGLSESDCFSMLSGLSHDPLLRDVFTPLTIGARVVIPDPVDVAAADGLIKWLRHHRISVVHSTPAMIRLLSDDGAGPAGALPDVRYAFLAGDVLTREDVSAFERLAPSATCVNFYGATETPQAMASFVIDPSDGSRHRIPVGRGIEDVQLLVLNASGELAGIGELGEIHVRTPHLSKGYFRDESLTRERFIINPLTARAGDRLYKTGDLGRYLPDGSVDFAGRNDTQIKIRGFRVELGEIEAALERHPAIRRSAVVAWDEPGRERRLVAYIVCGAGDAPAPAEVRRFLKDSLPDYMVPAAILAIAALPLLPSGKIDRRSLPAAYVTEKDLQGTYVAPGSPLEVTLARMWSELLKVRRVGVHDNFFELGGHSLLAGRLISRIRKTLDIDMPLRLLFDAPTVGQLAAALVQLGHSEEEKTPPQALTPRPRERYKATLDASGELVLTDALKKELSMENPE